MKVTAVRCPKCEDVIWSRARHDFRECTCGITFVDGGFDYLRTNAFDEKSVFQIDVSCTSEDAYTDWNRGYDKLGLIKDYPVASGVVDKST